MGKVKDESATRGAAKPAAKPSAIRDARRRVAPFLANLFRTTTYKPTQGWYARVWTGVSLGVLVAVGLYRLKVTQLDDRFASPVPPYLIPTGLAVALGWLTYRILQYPPFVDFLVATEAEMNKVSWTTRQDLYRATAVVLTTVILLAVFLFGVDYVWSSLLKVFHILQFDSAELGQDPGA